MFFFRRSNICSEIAYLISLIFFFRISNIFAVAASPVWFRNNSTDPATVSGASIPNNGTLSTPFSRCEDSRFQTWKIHVEVSKTVFAYVENNTDVTDISVKADAALFCCNRQTWCLKVFFFFFRLVFVVALIITVSYDIDHPPQDDNSNSTGNLTQNAFILDTLLALSWPRNGNLFINCISYFLVGLDWIETENILAFI